MKKCKFSRKSPLHSECPLHSPCHWEGTFSPQRCSPCHDIYRQVIAAANPRDCPGFDQLGNTLSLLMEALRRDSKSSNQLLVEDTLVRDWFPHLLPRSQSGVEPYGNEARLSKVEDTLVSIQAMVSSLLEGNRPSKRRRSPSPRPPPRGTPRFPSRTPSPSPSTRTDAGRERSISERDTDSIYGDTPSLKGATVPPSSDKGWTGVPPSWKITHSASELFASRKDDQDTWLKVPDIDLYAYLQEDRTSYFFRSRYQGGDPKPSPKDRARALGRSLATLATWCSGSDQAPSASLVRSESRAPQVLLNHIEVSSILKLEGMKDFWSAKAAGDKNNLSKGDNDVKPFTVTWAEGTKEHLMATFLQESTALQESIPSQLSRPDKVKASSDKELRAKARRTFSVSSSLALITEVLRWGAAKDSWSPEETQAFLGSVADAVEGAAATLAPRTRDDIRAAVTARVDLRSSAIPKEYSSSKPQLLALNVLSPNLYGDFQGVSDIIDSRPPPTVIDLKGYTPVASSSRQSQGSYSSSSSSSNRYSNQGAKKNTNQSFHKGDSQNKQSHNFDASTKPKPHGQGGRGGRGGSARGGHKPYNNPSDSNQTKPKI